MFKVKGTQITLIRGDTLLLQVGIKQKQDGSDYTPQNGDVIRFALKRAIMNKDHTNFEDEEPLATAIIPNDTLLLRLNPQDTKDLPFGKYHYDIQLTMSDGFVDTFLEGDFYLQAEVD